MLPEIKKLLAEIKPHKKRFTVVAVTGILNALATARVAFLSKVLFDALSANNQDELKKQVPIVIALGFIQSISRYYHLYNMNYISEAVVAQVRQKLQYKFMRLNLSFHNTYATGSGGLISRILNDIKTIQDGLRVVADIFLYPLLLIGLLVNLVVIDWKLTLAVLIVAPLVGMILKSVARSMRKYIPRERDTMEHMTSTIKESLDGVRVIQSFNLEKDMAKRLEDESNIFLKIRKIVFKRQEAAGPATEFIATSIVPLIMLYNSYEIAAGRGTAGNFIGFIVSLLMVNAPIKKIQEAYIRIQEVVISVRRIFEIIDNTSEVPEVANPVAFPKDWKKINYKNVSFSYGKEMILKNVNLEINRGEVVALVGASGSGKSTIVNLLERFFDSTSGEILIDGVNIRDMGLKDLRRNIALVTQDVFLFSDTIEKNIWAGDYNRDRNDIQKMAQLANAHDFIMKMPQGYQSRVGDRGNLLSGGEKQRVSIARAMFKDSPILILDEATSALDTASEIEVQKGLDHLLEGRTALVIAHRLSTIQKADKIVVMKAGQIVEIGTHASLLSLKGEYHNFHSLQQTT
ncbi:ABC transporter ATP-binding protein [Bdellovibrio sp. GT3]|uniref:ABC transporter ATP-binding protein n=1 Tax=Bdellovibrio sp. GT3 TaxID=3136282 RepID=UPI0030F08876